jgi:hypothetical protein
VALPRHRTDVDGLERPSGELTAPDALAVEVGDELLVGRDRQPERLGRGAELEVTCRQKGHRAGAAPLAGRPDPLRRPQVVATSKGLEDALDDRQAEEDAEGDEKETKAGRQTVQT